MMVLPYCCSGRPAPASSRARNAGSYPSSAPQGASPSSGDRSDSRSKSGMRLSGVSVVYRDSRCAPQRAQQSKVTSRPLTPLRIRQLGEEVARESRRRDRRHLVRQGHLWEHATESEVIWRVACPRLVLLCQLIDLPCCRRQQGHRGRFGPEARRYAFASS